MPVGLQVGFTLEESADLVSWSSIGRFSAGADSILEVGGCRFAASSKGKQVRLHVWGFADVPADRAVRIRIDGGPTVRLMGPGPPGVGP